MSKRTIQEVKAFASLQHPTITILEDEYINSKQKMKMWCNVCEYKFQKDYNSFSSRGSGCPSCGKNRAFVSKTDIAKHLKSGGYTLLEITDHDSHKGTCFTLKCSEGHIYETSYSEFNKKEKRSGSCETCSKSGNGKMNKIRVNNINENIAKLGYTVSDKVKRERTIHEFTCSNGHIRTLSYNSLARTPNCPECDGRKVRHTEESIAENLEKVGLKYISGFVRTGSHITYECECGNTDKGLYFMLLEGARCYDCLERKKWNFDKVKTYFNEQNCVLLEDAYTNNKIPLKFKCHCGEVGLKPFLSFLVFPKCHKCGISNKKRGEEHPSWNPNLTDEERKNKRKYSDYSKWRRDVFKRDNHSCQCCGNNKGGNLNAHHLNSHDWDIEGRVDPDNGITLCSLCHTDFHMLYGFGNNTKEQYEEYIEELYQSIIS